jgi:hypothetical protein
MKGRLANGAPCRFSRKQGLLFVNKKKQKNFINFSTGRLQHRAKRSKSFLVTFFQKSNCFPYSAA